MLAFVYSWAFNIIEKNNDNNANHIIKKVNSICQQLHPESVKWLGCKLECETILLTDENNSEMESIAVMLPYGMFVDLVENKWSRDWDFQALLKREESYFVNQREISAKMIKWLHDRNTSLSQLAKKIR